ncbi:MAG: hypothetical protein U1F36_03140 [Planctomycetota bacterium]
MGTVADEDTVTCGVDWLPMLTGVRDFVERGLVPALAQPGQGSSEFYWSIIDRRCHGEGGRFNTPVSGTSSTWLPDSDKEMLPLVVAHASATSNFAFPEPPPFLTDDGSEDPHDVFLARGVPGTPPPAYLSLDTSFGEGGRTAGAGLCLGADESLKSAVIGGVTYVYAGDADGIVHRFALAANPVDNQRSFREVDRSEVLGLGAWALAVGSFDGSGPRVVVGTLRHLYQLDAVTLQRIPGREYALDFEHERPRRLQVAEVHGGNPYPEILFTTFQGHLMVFDHQFQLLTDLGEPGIQDFVVGTGQSFAWAGTSSQTPIHLLSHRGHISTITVSDRVAQPNAPLAELHYWTQGQKGWPFDLELVAVPGGSQVAASYDLDPRFDAPIKRFDAANVSLPSSAHLGSGTNYQSLGSLIDLEALYGSGGALMGFVSTVGNYLNFVPTGSSPSARWTLLSTFSPADRPVAMLAVDLVPSIAGDPQEEIVVSTLAGHLVWFRLSEIPPFGSFTLPRPSLPPPPDAPPPYPRTNHSLAGAWGLIARKTWILNPDGDLFPDHHIYAATQDGELHDIAPATGNSKLLADMRHLNEARQPGQPPYYDAIQPEAPIRDLIWVDPNLTSIAAGLPELVKRIPPLGNPQPGWWLNTKPWLNTNFAWSSPVWYKDPDPQPGLPSFGSEPSPELPVYDGFVPLTGGGAVGSCVAGLPYTGERDFHWWRGALALYPNLIQGAWSGSTTVNGNWYSTADTQGAPTYGRAEGDCKDLRSMISDSNGTTYGLQSLRLGRDAVGRVIVASTSGGGIVLLRPSFGDHGKHGEILWSSEDLLQGRTQALDDGHGVMALAVRQVPGASPPMVDIFCGACVGYPDPAQLPPSGYASHPSSTIRWLRWDANGSTGAKMTQMGTILHLDPSVGDARGGFGLCGLALGDIVQDAQHPGAELVATTLEGDLFVFDIASGSINPAPLVRTWVPGALGAYNAILIEDLDWNPGNELYVAGSQGIWKWRQP